MTKVRNPEEMRALLNSAHSWPCMFEFKFIVPQHSLNALLSALPSKDSVEIRPSSQGKYQGVTAKLPMGSAQEVLDVYSAVQGIPGIISL